MSLSPLQLEALVVKRLEIVGRPKRAVPEGSAPAEWSYELRHAVAEHVSEPNKVRVEALFTFKGGRGAGFKRVAVEVAGYFALPPEAPEEIVATYVPELCLANLYGTVRGMVAQASGLFPNGPILLPLVNMHEILAHATPAQTGVAEEDSEAPPDDDRTGQPESGQPTAQRG